MTDEEHRRRSLAERLSSGTPAAPDAPSAIGTPPAKPTVLPAAEPAGPPVVATPLAEPAPPAKPTATPPAAPAAPSATGTPPAKTTALHAAEPAATRSAEPAPPAKPAATPPARPAVLNAETMPAIVETAIQVAIRQGQFDDLPGAGKPIPGLGDHHDPDWWIRRKIERESLTGLGPPALLLRVEDRELDAQLDALRGESDLRDVLDDFNRRVIEARRQLLGGPPVVTKPRDVEAEIKAWRERRRSPAIADPDPVATTKKRWFRRA